MQMRMDQHALSAIAGNGGMRQPAARSIMRVTANGVLLACSVAMTTAVAVAVFGDALGSQAKVAYDEIDVGRINVREEDGRLRLVISNQSAVPRPVFSRQGASASQPQDRRPAVLQ